jgi:hypothetical protein
MAISTINDAEQLSVVRTKINDNFSSIVSDLTSIDGRLGTLEHPVKAYALMDITGPDFTVGSTYAPLVRVFSKDKGSDLFDTADDGKGNLGVRYIGTVTKKFIIDVVIYTPICDATSIELVLFIDDDGTGLADKSLPVVSYPALMVGAPMFIHYSALVQLETNNMISLYAKGTGTTIVSPVASYIIREV